MAGIINVTDITSKIPSKVKTQKQIKGIRKISLKTPNLIYFPERIMTDNFTDKRMYITIYDSKSVSQIVEQLTNTAKKDAKSIKNAAENANGGVWDSSKAAVKEASKILGEIEDFRGVEKYIIALPIPNELSDSQAHDFSTDTGIVKDIADKVDSMNPLFSIQKAIGRIASTISTPRVLANPGYFQNYTGSQPRSFSFSFKMIPNSKVEAEKIMTIIKLIKKYSSPTLTADSIMMAPNFFHFWFSNTTLQNLTGIRPCIITDVSTNYAGSGILEMTMDGMPKQIDISITIKELRTITRDKWVV
jgi:hypothetical protein